MRGDMHWIRSPGGLLSLEKGTNCSRTSQELWLSRAKMATKRGAVQS